MLITIFSLRRVKGFVKRTNVNQFSKYSTKRFSKALNLKDDDELINVFLTDGQADVNDGDKIWLFCSILQKQMFEIWAALLQAYVEEQTP